LFAALQSSLHEMLGGIFLHRSWDESSPHKMWTPCLKNELLKEHWEYLQSLLTIKK
jgi:hypothetical protein